VDGRCPSCGCATQVGPYVIERFLAQGARGRTYLASDATGTRVALKETVFRTLAERDEAETFDRQVERLAQLSHPRIARVLGAFREGEGVHTRLYVAQEHIEGETLQARLTRGLLSEKEARVISAQVLDILAYLGEPQVQLSHGDIKPANLIVDGRKALWLVGGGPARLARGRETARDTRVGTLGYGPPEARDGTFDPTADLYALGATLIHLLGGLPPDVLRGDDLQIVVPWLPVSLPFKRFLRALVAARRERRPQSPAAALAMLRWPGPLSIPSVRRGLVAAVAGLTVLGVERVADRAPAPAATPSTPVVRAGLIFPEVPETLDQNILTIPGEDPGHVVEAIPVGVTLPRPFTTPKGTSLKARLAEILLYRHDVGPREDLMAVVEYTGPDGSGLPMNGWLALISQFADDVTRTPLKGNATDCIHIDPDLLSQETACVQIYTLPRSGEERLVRRYRFEFGGPVAAVTLQIDLDRRTVKGLPPSAGEKP
jgi:serine/threonine-protein kinase